MITGWHQKYNSEKLYSMFVALNLQCVYFYFERQWQMVMILYVREGGREGEEQLAAVTVVK